jgi:predicted ATPase/DNA-binding winged helix-turn-helix (wHTH) protein
MAPCATDLFIGSCKKYDEFVLRRIFDSNRYLDAALEQPIREMALTFGPFRFLPQQRLLTRSGLPLRVGSRALDILAVLLARAGEVVTKDEIVRRVWPDTVVEENNLRVHLTALRKLLGEGHLSGRFIENIPGRGYSFVATVEQQNELPEQPAAPITSIPFNNLPGTVGEVLGRDAVIAALVSQLPRRRLITLTGSGGVGKTTVALAAADRLLAVFPDGVAFVDLAAIDDSSLVPSAIASVLSCILSSEKPTEDLLQFLGARRLLLVLDNCEHVISGCASLVSALLKGTRGVAVLATSREPLRTSGEWVQQLPPLALPPLSAASNLQDAMQFPAVRLFVDRACAALASFNPTDADTPVIVGICNRLDGVALAIELAAGRINSMGLRGLASSLEASLNSLSHGQRTAVPRHQALRAMVDWSFNLLPNVEKSILRRLCVFNGPFSAEAARQVCTGADAPAQAIDEALLNLIAKSLVSADVSGDLVRYRLLETTRVYASEMLDAAGERPQVDRRHAEYYRSLFERAEAEWHNRPTAEWREAYADQIGNLRGALAWSYSTAGDAATGIAITVAAIPLWFQLSLVDECLEHVLQALASLEQANSSDDLRRMKLYAALGWPRMGKATSTLGGASAWRKALDIARRLNEMDFQLRSLWALWVDRINCARPREALELAREFHALALCTDEPADGWIGERMVGAALHFIGDQVSARRHLDRMLEFYVEPKNRSHAVRFQFDQRVTARVALARVLWLQGLTRRALDEVTDTVAYALAIDHKLSLANVLAEAACPIALMAGDLDLADRYITMLQEQTKAQALDVWSTYADCFSGESFIARGMSAKGFAALQAGLGRLRRGGFLLFESAFLAALARGYLQAGHAAEGTACVSEALQICESSGEGWCLPELVRLQGELYLLSDPADAANASETAFLQSLQTSRQQGTLAWELRTAVSCAKLYARRGRLSDARSLLTGVLGRFDAESISRDITEANSLLRTLANPISND